jgi:TonB family protein
MFDIVLASSTVRTRWSPAVTGALSLHILLLTAALYGRGIPRAAAAPAARDTIRMDLALVRPSRSDRPPASGSDPGTMVPPPPGVPDFALGAPEFPLPSFETSTPGVPQSSQASLPWRSESAASGDTLRPTFGVGDVDEPPELVEELHPRYPDALRRAGLSGLVRLQYVVGSNGKIEEGSIRVLQQSHPAFLLAAVEALRQSRFKPARRSGRPAAVLVQQTIRFSYR